MERDEMFKHACDWIENYNENILPCIKSNVVYAPSDVAVLLDQVADLTLFILYYDMTRDLTKEEIKMKEKLEKASEEINNILMEKDAELDELKGVYEAEDIQDERELQS